VVVAPDPVVIEQYYTKQPKVLVIGASELRDVGKSINTQHDGRHFVVLDSHLLTPQRVSQIVLAASACQYEFYVYFPPHSILTFFFVYQNECTSVCDTADLWTAVGCISSRYR
jgi:hypothetical protein